MNTPSEVTPEATPEKKRKRPLLWGCLSILAFIFVIFAISQILSGYRQFVANRGIKAYEAADCELALKRFGRLPEDGRHREEISTEERLCSGYLAAVSDREGGDYGDAFVTYLTDSELYAASPIGEFVEEEIDALFEEAEPDELANTETCSVLEESIVPDPESNLPLLYHACGQAYIGEKDFNTALDWQRDFLLDYPEHELADMVEENLLDNPLVCDQVKTLEKDQAIVNRDGFMPTLYFDCAEKHEDNNEPEQAFDLYLALLTDYPDAPQANRSAAALLDNPEACEQFDVLNKNRTIANRRNFIPDLLYNCGENSASAGELSAAIGFYEQLLDDYPEDSRAAEVEMTLAELLLAQAEAAGAGEIAAPGSSGYATTGTAVVIIQNDSPESLRIVFIGPETRIEELDRCVTCQVFAGVGPTYCPAEGPIGTYELIPGTYEVLVESSSDTGTTPFTGTWELGDGVEYSQCFFIVTTFE